MRSMRQRLAAVTLLTGLTTLGIGMAAGPANAAITACQGYLGDAPSGSLHITSTPAAGSDVTVGSPINFSASWDDHDFIETDRFLVCATVNGVWNEAMSSEDKGVNNNGSYSAAANIPSDMAPGSDVCFVTAIKGQFEGRITGEMVSETLCYKAAAAPVVQPAVETTTTTAAVVEPAVVEAGAPAGPAVEAAPAPVEAPAPLPVLPRTGSGIDLLAGLGGLAVAAGGTARYLGRRRPAEG